MTPSEQAAIAAAEQRTAQAEGAKHEAETDLMRLEVGQELDLDPSLRKRLRGSTKAEMKADAENLGAALESMAEPPRDMNDLVRARTRRGVTRADEGIAPDGIDRAIRRMAGR